jgi:hypothetical protein
MRNASNVQNNYARCDRSRGRVFASVVFKCNARDCRVSGKESSSTKQTAVSQNVVKNSNCACVKFDGARFVCANSWRRNGRLPRSASESQNYLLLKPMTDRFYSVSATWRIRIVSILTVSV